MDDESSDILGQQTKPALRSAKSSGGNAWLGASLTIQLILGFLALLSLYVVFMRIWFRILLWKERSYKLATRRKHGIPDNDHRPFNVAYATVLLNRREKEDIQKAKVLNHNVRRSAERERNLRQRLGRQVPAEQRRASSFGVRFPGAFFMEGSPASHHPESSAPPPASHAAPPISQVQKSSTSAQHQHEAPSYLSGLRVGKRDLDSGNERSNRKRGYVEDLTGEQETIKRSKWENGIEDGRPARQSQVLPQRVAKRYLLDDDENTDYLLERQPRGKRARKVSLDQGIQAQMGQDMDVDEDDDDVDDLPNMLRGKKRDRTEAGSTFGGDDDESGPEQDQHELKSTRRGRKRRTFSKRTTDLKEMTRGQKRDRDLGDDGAERDIGEENSRPYRKKRGKRAVHIEAELSEHSNAPSHSSISIRDRKIGEEWTSNGIKWKLGDNGQRLRQALVKKAGQKFSMPEDSQHPDREADFEVYVESWLSEEEYRDAKSRLVLVGQGTFKRLEPKLGIDVERHVNGKDLLWSAKPTWSESPTPGSPESDVEGHRNNRNHRMNPFDQTQVHHVRRISAVSRTSSIGTPGLVDSTNSNPHGLIRTYSKLEKQELEARALLRLREMRNAKKVEIDQSKADEAAKEKENVEKARTAVTIPAITVTAPTESSNQPTQSTSLSKAPEVAGVTSKQAEPLKLPNIFSSAASKLSTDSKLPEGAKPSLFGPSSSTTNPAFPFAPLAPAASKAGEKTTAALPSSAPQPASNPFAPSSNQAPSLGFFNMPSSSSTAASNTSAVPTSGSKSTPALAPTGNNNPPSSGLGAQTGAAGSTPSSFFNFAAQPSKSATPNPFATQPSQSAAAPAASGTSTSSTGLLKFNFGLAGSSSGSSGNAPAKPAMTTSATSAPAATVPSSNPFTSAVKNHSTLSTSFTPFASNAGAKAENEAMSNSATKPTPSQYGFGFTVPNASTTNVSGPAGNSAFGAPAGATNLFSTANTSHNPMFGSTVLGAKPAENKTTESSGTSQPEKPLFKFNFGGGQLSSGDTSSSQSRRDTQPSSSEGTAKPASTSSSLFNALGSQSTSGFGSTSDPNTGKNANIFGTSNQTSTTTSGSAPPNIFKAPSTAFGNASANVFGNNNAGTSGVFGSAGSKPSEAPNSIFSAMPATSAPEQQKPLFSPKPSQFNSAINAHNQPTTASSSTAPSSGSTFKFNFELNKNPASSSAPSSSIFSTPGSNKTAASSNPLTSMSSQPPSVFGTTGSGNQVTSSNTFTSTSTQPPSIFGAPSSNSAATSSNPLSTTQPSSIFGSANTATPTPFPLRPAAFGSTSNFSPFNPSGGASGALG